MIQLINKYFSGVFFLNTPSLLNSLIALVTLPIILSHLPVADYGKWQFILAIQIWLSVFTGENITVGSKRGIAQGLDGTLLYGLFSRLKLLTPLGAVVIGTAFFVRIFGLQDSTFAILLLIIGIYLVFGYVFQKSLHEFLIAKKRFKAWSFWQMLITSLSTIIATWAALHTGNIVYFASFYLGSVVLLSGTGFVWILKKEKVVESYRKGEIDKKCESYGLKLIPVDLISQTGVKISHFVIGPFFGFANLAVFSVANKLRDKCAGVIKTARPLFYADFARTDKKELTKTINRHLVRMGIIGIFFTIIFMGLGWFYIKFFLPESFQAAIKYFFILVLSMPAVTMAIVFHTALESHLRYKELSLAIVFSNVLRLFLIILFGYFWQITGICVALMMSSWITCGFYYILTLKKESAEAVLENVPFLERLSNTYSLL